jgi:hypothetical protein
MIFYSREKLFLVILPPNHRVTADCVVGHLLHSDVGFYIDFAFDRGRVDIGFNFRVSKTREQIIPPASQNL